MILPTEEELRAMVGNCTTDAEIGQQFGCTQRDIQRLRKSFGIACCRPKYSNGIFVAFEREIRALIEPGAAQRMALAWFEDSPAAIKAQTGGYGRLPPRAEFGTRGGSMIMVERC